MSKNISNAKYWYCEESSAYYPRGDSKKTKIIPPGVYDIKRSMEGPYFQRIEFTEDALLKLEGTVVDQAVQEINIFWGKKEMFKKFKFPFKRGILLHGPPGTGKSCTIKLIINDVIAAGGIAVRFSNYDNFYTGMTKLRAIQPDVPVVVVMEDLDSIMESGYEICVLNLLDGLSGFENIVYLATTNHLNDLEDRVKNRPSRFDRLFLINYPGAEARKMYLNHLLESDKFDISVDKWVQDTENFSIAHLKELFISVCFFNSDYNETLKRLKTLNAESLNDNHEEIDEEDNDYDDGPSTYIDSPPNGQY